MVDNLSERKLELSKILPELFEEGLQEILMDFFATILVFCLLTETTIDKLFLILTFCEDDEPPSILVYRILQKCREYMVKLSISNNCEPLLKILKKSLNLGDE